MGCVMKLATTGKAASVIGGSTVHSRKNGIGLPVGRQKYRDLSSNMLKQAQKRFKGVKLIIIDEYSMLRQKELFYISQILKQISGTNDAFGGFTVLLVGDPAQIPAVLGRVVWDSSNGGTEADDFGLILYNDLFTLSILCIITFFGNTKIYTNGFNCCGIAKP